MNCRGLHLKQKLHHVFLPGYSQSCARWFSHVALDVHQQMSTLLIPLAASPRRSGKSCQASTSWTIFTSSANMLNLQITSRKCPQSNIFWNKTKKKKSIILFCKWWAYGLCPFITNLEIIPFGTWKAKNPSQPWILFYCHLGFRGLQVLHCFPFGFQCCWKHELLSVTSFALCIPQGWHLISGQDTSAFSCTESLAAALQLGAENQW